MNYAEYQGWPGFAGTKENRDTAANDNIEK